MRHLLVIPLAIIVAVGWAVGLAFWLLMVPVVAVQRLRGVEVGIQEL